MNYGFVKVAAAAPKVKVADCFYNTQQIELSMREAASKGVQLIAFPELSVTGYTCMDLFMQHTLLYNAEKALLELIDNTKELDLFTVVGMPLMTENRLINSAVVFCKGEILGVVPKTNLTNYKEFQEERWFSSALSLRDNVIRIGEDYYPMDSQLIFTSGEVAVGVEICEDLWVPVPPSSQLSMLGANVILNISASNELSGKHVYRRQLVAQQSGRCLSGYVYASSGYGESTTDMVFAGSCMIAENNTILKETERFSLDSQLIVSEIDIESLMHERRVSTSFMKSNGIFLPEEVIQIPFDLPETAMPFELTRLIDASPFIPCAEDLAVRCEEIVKIQVYGLAKRMDHTCCKTAVVGVSGGLDSTLALLVTVMTFDLLGLPREQIIGITMPGFGTTDRTYTNAIGLIQSLGVTFREISIKDACLQHFKDIGHDVNIHDVTFENAQARERTQILMDIANQVNGLVIGTGDLSELALGWATYNGDHMSMYGVNSGVPKTLVKHLTDWIAENKVSDEARAILKDVIDTPISPELIPADNEGNIKQKTEDLVGPYELHDFFIYNFIRFGSRPEKIYFLARKAFDGKYDAGTIKKWLHVFFRRFFQQQFKRSCLPDGPKVGSISLSPRGDWRMPSDAVAVMWLKEIEELD